MSVLKEMALCSASSFGEREILKETAARSGRDIWTLRGAGATGVKGPTPDQVGGAELQPRGPCWVGEPPPLPSQLLAFPRVPGWAENRSFHPAVFIFGFNLPASSSFLLPWSPLPHKLLPGLSPRSDSRARNREQPFLFLPPCARTPFPLTI